MGVKGLQSYIEKNCPEVCSTVKLRQLTDNYKISHPGMEPVIVVDALACLSFFNEKVEWLYGGQFLQIKARIEKFVRSFRDLGITLIFFFDGLMASSKTSEWINRRLATLNKAASVFYSIKSQTPIEQDIEQIYPGGVTQAYERAIKDVCQSAVFINMMGECDTTVASYAVEHQCMAILGQDTDYLIYDTGDIPYLLVNNLKFNTMETMTYSQTKFCQKTGIKAWLLPLFACLTGNDSVTRDQLTDFHHELHQRYANYRSSYPVSTQKAIQFVIRYMNINSIDKPEKLNGLISQICLTMPMGQISSRKLCDAIAVYRLDTSLIKYFPSPKNWKQKIVDFINYKIFEVVFNKSARYDLVPVVYQVLAFGKVERLPSLEDEADKSFDNIVIIFRKLRCQMYSVIFKFRDSHLQKKEPVYWGNTVEEYCVMTAKKSLLPDVVTPIPIEASPFDVYAFWLDHENELKDEKTKALISIMGSTISPDTLFDIPDRFKTLCLLLNYLIQHPGVPLTIMDVDAFLVQAVVPNGENLRWIAELQVKHQTRPVHLAAIFGRGIPQVMDVVSLCGNPFPIASVAAWNFFDGKRFHYCWSELKFGQQNIEQLCLGNVTSLGLFKQLKKATFEGIDMKKFRS